MSENNNPSTNDSSVVTPLVSGSDATNRAHGNRIYVGDALEKLKEWPSESVQCVVTSPPYWGLRDYGTAKWVGGNPECSHRRDSKKSDKTITGHKNFDNMLGVGDAIYKDTCGQCGAKRIDRQIGLEKTPEEYIAKLVLVFDEVRRVLRNDGVCWVNIGDTYASNWGAGAKRDSSWWSTRSGEKEGKGWGEIETAIPANMWKGHPIIKPKDLCLIPARFSIALQEAGWWIRSDTIWSKPNAMPESAEDRPTKAHEYVFLITKSASYYYNADAIREPYTKPLDRWGGEVLDRVNPKNGTQGSPASLARQRDMRPNKDGRNRRSVWEINTEPFTGAHFATFPTELVRLCILAGSKIGDIVADPFLGSGTTGEVAIRLGRYIWGIDISAKYIRELAQPRLNNVEPLFKDAVAVLS